MTKAEAAACAMKLRGLGLDAKLRFNPYTSEGNVSRNSWYVGVYGYRHPKFWNSASEGFGGVSDLRSLEHCEAGSCGCDAPCAWVRDA